MARFRLIVGDVREKLRDLPAESVQCVVTSPPYWGLRDYGVDGQLGLEKTPEEYVAKMVEVFREVRRVLRDDGTLWLNMGDCYATGAGAVGECPGGGAQGARWAGRGTNIVESNGRGERRTEHAGKHTGIVALGPMTQPNRMPLPGLKPKDLVGIPWRVAFALQADGWWLRSDIVWSKPNPMPESVEDRPTKAHEYLFLLAKSERYFYNKDAIAEPGQDWGPRDRSESKHNGEMFRANGQPPHRGLTDGDASAGRNKRSVWTIATQPFQGAHFATFPEALGEPCILAGSKPGDTVLDPFAGSGTVGVVALKRGRDFLGIELKPSYAEMAERRIAGDSPLFNVSANDSGPHAPGEDDAHTEGEAQPVQTVLGQVVDG